jgi:hypothetical protein
MTNFFSWAHVRQTAFLPVLGILATAGAAQAQTPVVTFVLQANSPDSGGNTPLGMAVADVNGDGRPDALIANGNSNKLGVLLNNGAGVFVLQTNALDTGGYAPESVVIADVNGDGRPDALVANSSSGTVGVLLNDGAGNFILQANAPSTGGNPRALVVADVNGDRRPDVLVANQNTNTLGVLLNDGAGRFTLQAGSPSTGPTSSLYGLAVADVNGDGRPDALVANANASKLLVLLNDGTGSFTLQANAPSTGADGGPTSVAVADANGDGRPDALVTNSSKATLGVLLNDGTGSFTLQANSPSTGAGTYPRSLAVADVNGDGRPDVLVGNEYTDTLGILLGTATGNFTLQPNAPSTGNRGIPVSVAAADVNGDGRPDALVANFSSNTLGVLLNTTAYTPLATQAALPGTSTTLHPNPAATYATLTLGGLPAAVAQVQATLLDASGRAVHQYTLAAGQGRVRADVPTAGLAAGLYLLRLAPLDAQGTPAGSLPTQRLSVY